MTDREMVQKAAGAIGLKLHWDVEGVAWKKWPSFKWNPLTSSADAFELAVKLSMCVSIHAGHCMACAQLGTMQTETGSDTAAATRRAITRAAAAIQEAKEGV